MHWNKKNGNLSGSTKRVDLALARQTAGRSLSTALSIWNGRVVV